MRIGGPWLKMAKGRSPRCVADDHNCTVLEMFLGERCRNQIGTNPSSNLWDSMGIFNLRAPRVCSTGLVKWEIFK
jgi:hypothetical protein